VTVKGDQRREADEWFTLALDRPVGVTFTDPSGRGTIVDDD
jgi:hypothetical protein